MLWRHVKVRCQTFLVDLPPYLITILNDNLVSNVNVHLIEGVGKNWAIHQIFLAR